MSVPNELKLELRTFVPEELGRGGDSEPVIGAIYTNNGSYVNGNSPSKSFRGLEGSFFYRVVPFESGLSPEGIVQDLVQRFRVVGVESSLQGVAGFVTDKGKARKIVDYVSG